MKFKDLVLPREQGRKKKISLYKCFIYPPFRKGDAKRELDINEDRDRYGLTQMSAIQYTLDQMGREEVLEKIQDGKIFNDFVVVLEINLVNGCLEMPILVPPPNEDVEMSLDPDYNEKDFLLSATIRDRISTVKISTFNIKDIKVFFEDSTGRVIIEELKLEPVIINSALTGE